MGGVDIFRQLRRCADVVGGCQRQQPLFFRRGDVQGFDEIVERFLIDAFAAGDGFEFFVRPDYVTLA